MNAHLIRTAAQYRLLDLYEEARLARQRNCAARPFGAPVATQTPSDVRIALRELTWSRR